MAGPPEKLAVEYLAKEVPRWSIENGCFSCHNNGDAARALYAAVRPYPSAQFALKATNRWLATPDKWEEGWKNPAYSDKKLSQVQFAAALAAAVQAGQITDHSVLVAAANSLIPLQDSDGSWQVGAEAAIGSPATYGPVLATYLARSVLQQTRAARFDGPIGKSSAWLRSRNPANTVDTAALILSFPTDAERHLAQLEQWQTSDGGWGPRRSAPAEAFDTALVLLALQSIPSTKRTHFLIERGRAFLIGMQQEEGGWPETTRPAGNQSYAQHISTSGWATLALLATDREGK